VRLKNKQTECMVDMNSKRQAMIDVSYVSRHQGGDKIDCARLDILSGEVFDIQDNVDGTDLGRHEGDFISIPGHSMLYPVSTEILDRHTLASAFVESDILVERIGRMCQFSASDENCQCYFGVSALYLMDADVMVKNTMTGSVKPVSIILNQIPLRERLNEISRHAASVHAAMRYLSFVSISDDMQSIMAAMYHNDDQLFSDMGVIVRPEFESMSLTDVATLIHAAETIIQDAIKMVADSAVNLSERQDPRGLVTVSSGRADSIADKHVTVEIFDAENYRAGYQKSIPNNFADLAALAGISVDITPPFMERLPPIRSRRIAP